MLSYRVRRGFRSIASLTLSASFLCVAARAASAQTGANVLVVANEQSERSVKIAEYYAQKRAIPAAQVLKLHIPADEEIDRATYVRQIEMPLATWLSKNDAQDRILYIVLTKDVPIRVAGTPGRRGTVASVDSELTLLYRKMTGAGVPVPGSVPNPYFAAPGSPIPKPFTHDLADMYLVTRLDAYTVPEVTGLIDRAAAPAHSGEFILDERATTGDRLGDRWLEEAAEALRKLGVTQVVLDRTTDIVVGHGGVLGYYSWGSNDPSFTRRKLGMAFLPGAIAATFVSTDARTFREPPADWSIGSWTNPASFYAGSPQSLVGDLLREGVTGAAGHVAEPYLDATIRPNVLFPAYVSGLNLAEAFYAAMPYLSWQTVVIGDPLCAPFRKSAIPTEEADPEIDPATELPKDFSKRRLAELSKIVPSTQQATALLKATGRMEQGDRAGARSVLEEALRADATFIPGERMLAQMEEADKRYDRAIELYRRLVEQVPNDPLTLNNLSYLVATHLKKPDEALPLAERAAAIAPRSAAVKDTLAWVHHLKGDDRQAATVIDEALKLDPNLADAFVHAAAIHLALREADAAQRALHEALRLQPNLASRDDVQRLQADLKRLTSG